MPKETNLEERVWYRLLKVLYGVGLLIVAALTVLVFLVTKPTGFVNLSQSSITCPNSSVYSLSFVAGFYAKNDTHLNPEDNLNALKACGLDKARVRVRSISTGEIGTIEAWDFDPSLVQLLADSGTPPYTINWVTDETYDRWVESIGWAFGALLISGSLLALLRGAIMYVLLGKFEFKLPPFVPVGNR